VVRAKEAIEAENVEIKRRLASIIGMLQPLVGPSEFETWNSRPFSTSNSTTCRYPWHGPYPPIQRSTSIRRHYEYHCLSSCSIRKFCISYRSNG
jgi:hypothetical protein